MDLSFKPEYEDFRKEVIEFLDSELTNELREAGKLTASVFSEVEYSSKWHKILHKKDGLAENGQNNMVVQVGMICKDIFFLLNALKQVRHLQQLWD